MNFAGVDTWAILIAAVGGYVAGAAWYWGFCKPWVASQGLTPEAHKSRTWVFPFVLVFVANLVMARALAGILGHSASAS